MFILEHSQIFFALLSINTVIVLLAPYRTIDQANGGTVKALSAHITAILGLASVVVGFLF